jgi:hypothetical protein
MPKVPPRNRASGKAAYLFGLLALDDPERFMAEYVIEQEITDQALATRPDGEGD